MCIVRDVRGVASVEITVMLPVFIVLFCAGVHLEKVVTAGHRASARARACAWQWALTGCGDVRPSLCAGVAQEGRDPRALESRGEAKSALEHIMRMPVLGEAVEAVLGRGASASAIEEVPRFRQAGHSEVAREIHLVCNPVPARWDDKLSELVCHVAGKVGLERVCR